MNDKKQIKIDGKIKNPCYNRETETDCPLRAVGCREKCNKYKIYKTLKAVEQRHKNQKKKDDELFFDVAKSTARRLNKRTYDRHKEK